MISITSLEVYDQTCLGVKVELPDSPPLLLIIARKGFVMCGFLNIDAAERLKVAAAIVSGVKTFEAVLEAHIKVATSRAESMGVHAGMKGVEALKRMS